MMMVLEKLKRKRKKGRRCFDRASADGGSSQVLVGFW